MSKEAELNERIAAMQKEREELTGALEEARAEIEAQEAEAERWKSKAAEADKDLRKTETQYARTLAMLGGARVELEQVKAHAYDLLVEIEEKGRRV